MASKSSNDLYRKLCASKQLQKTRKRSVKSPDFSRHHGKSNTIRMEPIPRGFTESHIYDLVMTAVENELLSITLNTASKKLKNHENCKLHDAQIGYVVLQSPQDALQCASKLNGQSAFGGYECSVIISQQSYRSFADCKDKTKWIKLTNIGKDIDEQSIIKHIEEQCKISVPSTSVILSHHQTKEHYPGFASVELETTEDATKCVQLLRNKKLNDNKIWATWRPSPKTLETKEDLRSKTKRLILSNLHWTLNHNDILKLCAACCKVEHISVWKDKSGYPSGRASVTVEDEQSASKVFDELNGKIVKGLEIMAAYKENKVNKKNVNEKKKDSKVKQKLNKKRKLDDKDNKLNDNPVPAKKQKIDAVPINPFL